MTTQEIAVPLAYFITFTCYGTWLHGEKSTSVDRNCNIAGTDFIPYIPERAQIVKILMKEKPYLLDSSARSIVLRAIQNVCAHRKWTLLAAHVRTNHVHIVVHAMIAPETIMTTIKGYASRYLNDAKIDPYRTKRWTRHGSTRYLWKAEEVEATIQYVIHEQGKPMAVLENKERLFEKTTP